MKNFTYRYHWNGQWYTFTARGETDKRLADASFRNFLSRKPGARAGKDAFMQPTQGSVATDPCPSDPPAAQKLQVCGHGCHRLHDGNCITKGCDKNKTEKPWHI